MQFSVVFPRVGLLYMNVQARNGRMVVCSFSRTADGRLGPAEECGRIQRGDIVVGVNTLSFTGMTYREQTSCIRRAVGDVRLHFFRETDYVLKKPSVELQRAGGDPSKVNPHLLVQWSDPTSEERFATLVKNLLQQKQISQASLAGDVKISAVTLSRWLNGRLSHRAGSRIIVGVYFWMNLKHKGFCEPLSKLIDGGDEGMAQAFEFYKARMLQSTAAKIQQANMPVDERVVTGKPKEKKIISEGDSSAHPVRVGDEYQILPPEWSGVQPSAPIVTVDLKQWVQDAIAKRQKSGDTFDVDQLILQAVSDGVDPPDVRSRVNTEYIVYKPGVTPPDLEDQLLHFVPHREAERMLSVLYVCDGNVEDAFRVARRMRVLQPAYSACKSFAQARGQIPALERAKLDEKRAEYIKAGRLPDTAVIEGGVDEPPVAPVLEAMAGTSPITPPRWCDHDWRSWTTLEKQRFSTSVFGRGKDYGAIAKDVMTRRPDEVIQYYYAGWKTSARYASWKRTQEAEDDEELEFHRDVCEVCNEMGNLLCCDSCKLAYHTHCLSPPITSVPEGDWACPECVASGMSAQALAKQRAFVQAECKRLEEIKNMKEQRRHGRVAYPEYVLPEDLSRQGRAVRIISELPDGVAPVHLAGAGDPRLVKRGIQPDTHSEPEDESMEPTITEATEVIEGAVDVETVSPAVAAKTSVGRAFGTSPPTGTLTAPVSAGAASTASAPSSSSGSAVPPSAAMPPPNSLPLAPQLGRPFPPGPTGTPVTTSVLQRPTPPMGTIIEPGRPPKRKAAEPEPVVDVTTVDEPPSTVKRQHT